MNRIRIPIAALFALPLLALPASSRAAATVGDKADISFKAVDGTPVSLDKLKGKIVVVDFWATWCNPCMAMVGEMVAIHKQYHDKGLQMVGISLDQDKAALQRVVKEKGFAWPQYFDGKGWDNPIWKQYGERGIPFTLLVAPDGTILWKGHPGNGLKNEIDKAFKEHPPQLVDEKTLGKAKAQLDEIEQKNKAGETAAALKLLAKVPELARADKDTAERMDKLAASVGAEADKMLAEVNPLVEKGDYAQAIARLKDVSRALAGTPLAAKARRQLNDLMNKPEVREKVESAEKGARADEALAAARELEKQKKDELAYNRYKSIAKEFPDTAAATTAAAVIKRYEADPAFVKRINEKETGSKAKAALSMARSYRTAHKTDQARQKYQSIIQEFPNTPYAQTAQQELSSLGR